MAKNKNKNKFPRNIKPSVILAEVGIEKGELWDQHFSAERSLPRDGMNSHSICISCGNRHVLNIDCWKQYI